MSCGINHPATGENAMSKKMIDAINRFAADGWFLAKISHRPCHKLMPVFAIMRKGDEFISVEKDGSHEHISIKP